MPQLLKTNLKKTTTMSMSALKGYPHLPHANAMTERLCDKILMNLVQRILGLTVTDPEDPNNSYIRFFLKDVRYGFGPNKVLVDLILDVRTNHRELAAVLAWMEHKARKFAFPTRKIISDVTALYLDVDSRIRALTCILDMPKEAQVDFVNKVCTRSHSAMNDTMELIYGLPEKEQNGCLRFRAVDDLTDPDVLLKFLVCDFYNISRHGTSDCGVRSGVAGCIFFAPPHVHNNGEDFGDLFTRLERLNPASVRTTILLLLELIYDVRQSFVEFAAITAAMDVVEPKTERERYQRKERRDMYKDLYTKISFLKQDFLHLWNRKDAPKVDASLIKRRLTEIMIVTSSCCHVAGTVSLCLMDLRKPEHGDLCQTCKAPGRLDGVTLNACSRCREAKYCCRECQTADWQQHKLTCRSPSSPSREGDKKGSMERECANCAVKDVGLFPCSVCKLVDYCGKACQTQHWKDGKHKKFLHREGCPTPWTPTARGT
jgi:hypothetical protein